MRDRRIAIGFDGAAQPSYRLLLLAEVQFGRSRNKTPYLYKSIAETKAQRLILNHNTTSICKSGKSRDVRGAAY
jgi:hypothetical protein